jgi:homoserine kinase
MRGSELELPVVELPVVDLSVGARAGVRVPATSANLGPGFDALGLALAWYDDVNVEITAAGLTFDITGEGADTAPEDESHLVVRTLLDALAELGVRAPGLRLSSTNRIPHGRGLGSSAAAICAGVLLAQELASGVHIRTPPGWTLATAARVEGHPDNVAPCLLGGLTVAWAGADGATAIALDPVAELRPVLFVPPHESSTHAARRLLPEQVTHHDAAFNAARAALLVAGLTARPEVLLDATEDRLHQHYRAPVMPESAELISRLRTAGLPAVISGAGPTVLVLASSESAAGLAVALAPVGWRVAQVEVDPDGATVVAPSNGSPG